MQCPECGATVTSLREYCPECRAPLHRSQRADRPRAPLGRTEAELNRNRKTVLAVGGALLVGLLLVGRGSFFGGTIDLGSHHRARGPVEVQADQLFRAYRDDAHEADRKYGHREIVATGEFVRIAPDDRGDPDLRLKTSDPEAPLGIDMIRASFAQATQLKPGEIVTVSCERVARTGDERWLRNCAIQSVKEGAGAASQPTEAGNKAS